MAFQSIHVRLVRVVARRRTCENWRNGTPRPSLSKLASRPFHLFRASAEFPQSLENGSHSGRIQGILAPPKSRANEFSSSVQSVVSRNGRSIRSLYGAQSRASDKQSRRGWTCDCEFHVLFFWFVVYRHHYPLSRRGRGFSKPAGTSEPSIFGLAGVLIQVQPILGTIETK